MKHRINAADLLTASRIVFAVFILLCAAFSVQFYVFYLLGAFTDMTDGWIARKMELESSFGAKLDTIADFVFIMAAMVKLLMAVYVPKWLWVWIAVIVVLKLINLLTGLLISHRLVSMHTLMNKTTGFMLFLLPFCVGRGSSQTLAIAAIIVCSTATFAAIQEGCFIRAGKDIE